MAGNSARLRTSVHILVACSVILAGVAQPARVANARQRGDTVAQEVPSTSEVNVNSLPQADASLAAPNPSEVITTVLPTPTSPAFPSPPAISWTTTISGPSFAPLTMTAPMSIVDNADVIATIDLPVETETAPVIANTFPVEAGDKVSPVLADGAQPQETPQPVYVLANTSRAKNNGPATVQLSLQVITPTDALDIALSLPTGLEYVDKSSGRAKYDAATRQLLWSGVAVDRNTSAVDSFTLNVNAPSVPASLPMAITWRTAKGDLSGQSTSSVAVGDDYTSPVLSLSAGGKVRASDKIELDFPPGALKTDTAISVATYATFFTPGPNKRDIAVLPFSLGPDMAFDQPVTVTVNTAGLFSDDLISETGRLPALQYIYTEVITPAKRDDGALITATVQTIEDMPSSYDAKTGILTAQVMHFSDYQVSLQQPVNPQLWKLSANGGNVSLFRGALSYAYPIAAPAMVGGLQPNLALNYSSAAADSGFDQQYQPGENLSMGAGWSIEVPKITRAVRRGFVCPGGVDWQYQCGGASGYNGEYANDFTLSLGGKTHTLIARGGGEYVPEDYAPIKARLCNDQTPCTGSLAVPGVSNVTGEWWQVWTPDGTRWVFGVDTTTENVVSMYQWDWQYNVSNPYQPGVREYGGYAGHATGAIARAWFLRRAYASVRDSVTSGLWSVQWQYETGTNNITAPFTICTTWCYNPTQPDAWARPSSILYGPSVRPNATAATQRWKALFQYGWGPRLLNIVTSMADVNGNTLAWQRNYQLGTGSGQPMDSVLEYGINSAGSWQAGAPATTFSYTQYQHNNNSGNGNQRPLLTTIKNGYGAEWSYDYAGDQVLNSYWITKATTKSLIGGQVKWTGVRTYVYSANKCVANSASAGQCVNAAHVHFSAWPNNVVGFEWVKERVVNPGNTATIYAETQHIFHYNNLHKLGRESLTRTFDYSSGAAVEVAAQTTDYYDWPDATGAHGLPAGGWFVAAKAVNVYPFGGVNSSPYQRTTYEYDNNTNFGSAALPLVGANVTRVVNHGFVCANAYCSGDEVTTQTGYYPNTSAWIVGKPGFENVYEGADETNVWPANFRSQALIYYDGQGDYHSPPTQGLVTKVGRGNAGNAAEWATQQISYDATGNISTITDARGNTTNAYYDSNGWFLTETRTPSLPGVGQLVTRYRYYGVDTSGCASGGFGMVGLLKCTLDPNGQATTYAYDHYGRLRKLIKPYDTYAHPTEEYFYYDAHSPFFTQRFVRKQSGVGVARSGYDSGWWQCATCGVDLNALGLWERTFADGLGRTIETQRPMADWANSGGQMAIAWASYDAFGRAWQQSVPYQEAYAGANYRAPNTSVARTTTTYDGQNRVKTVTGPDGAVTTHDYGLDNNAAQGYTPTQAWAVHSVVDPNSHAKHQVSDGLGRMRMVREFTGTNPWTMYAETRYDYDALGNLIDVWDAANNNTHITYDALGRKTSMSDPDMGYWQYLYDANGNLISQTDAKGQTLTFDYDALNRLTYKRHNGVALAWHIYDAWWDGTPKPNLKGRRTGAVAYVDGAWNNSKTWEYDARGRSAKQTTYTDVGNFDDSYVYDSADRVTQMTYPTGERVVTGYDPASQPVRLHSLDWYASGTSVDYVASASYNALGQLKQANYGNGSRDQYDYYGPDIGNNWWSSGSNPYGRLWRKLVWSATNYPLLDLQYGHDGAGNVTARFVSNTWGASWEGTRFSYDEHNRLTGAAPWPGYAGESESYTYDAIGNLTSKTGVGSYSYTTWGGCADGIKPHAVRTAGPNGYCYDANGNVTWRYEGGRLWLNSWTADNKLASAQEKSPVDWATNIGVATQYFYDADGQRMKRVSGGVTTIYIGDHTEYVQGIKWVQYYSLGGQRVAMRDNIGPTAGSVVWLHGDHLGSASIATADTGQPVTSSETRYTPYGEVRPGFGTGIPTNRKFTGQREETNIGLYDYGARFYSPTLGRFISADTIVPGAGNPQALNRYSMVFNNPLKYTDPTGHCPTPPLGMGAAICMALFIQSPRVDVAGGIWTLHGDGRRFSSNSSPSQSRGYIWISVDENKQIAFMTSTGYIRKGATSVDPSLGSAVWNGEEYIEWHDPSSQNSWTIQRGPNGEINVTYDLVLSGDLENVAPHINGNITFRPNGKGGYEAEGERDGFPWAEAYYHNGKGGVQTIFLRPAIKGDPENLNALGEGSLIPLRPLYLSRHVFLNELINQRINRQYPRIDRIGGCNPGSPC